MTGLHRHYRELVLTSDRNDALRDNVEELMEVRNELMLARTRGSERSFQLAMGLALAIVALAASRFEKAGPWVSGIVSAVGLALIGWCWWKAASERSGSARDVALAQEAIAATRAMRRRARHFAAIGDAGLLYRTALDMRQLLIDRGETVDSVVQNAVDGNLRRLEVLEQTFVDAQKQSGADRWYPELSPDDLETLIRFTRIYMGRDVGGTEKPDVEQPDSPPSAGAAGPT